MTTGIRNITCPICTRPLLAFLPQPDGSVVMESYGSDMLPKKSPTVPGQIDVWAVCAKNGCPGSIYAHSMKST